jgi:type I restriction enzyme, S subunit
MNNIEFEKFDKLFKFLPKSKIKAGEGLIEGKYKFFTSSNIQSQYLNEFLYDTESLIFGSGGKASIHYCDKKFATSTDCFVVEKLNDKIDVKYAYYFFKTNSQILENGFKGAALKHISKKYISNIRIPLLSLENQKKIAQYLSQIERIKNDRKYSITLLESFLKNTFLEMIIFNEDAENWEKPIIERLLLKQKNSIRTGPFGSDLLHSEFTKNGDVAVLGIDNVVQNKFTWDEKRYISFEKYQKLSRYKINPKDVLITIMGTIGRTAVVPEDIPIAINTKHLAALSLNQELANPEFIAYSLRENPQILSQLKKKAKGVIMDGLNLTIIKNLKIVLPPIQLQDKFSIILKKIENTKITYEDSLHELNELFESVSQKAFS